VGKSRSVNIEANDATRRAVSMRSSCLLVRKSIDDSRRWALESAANRRSRKPRA